MIRILIDTPSDFKYLECLVYLSRSDLECLHKVVGQSVFKLLKIESQKYLIKIDPCADNTQLQVTILDESVVTPGVIDDIKHYVSEMFDLKKDLTSFYELAEKDEIANWVISRYKGLRIVKINDIFEGFCWSIIGQQINLKFAYTLKKRFVEKYGESKYFNNEIYHLFPEPSVISKLTLDSLKDLQFTTRKAEYIIGIANLFNSGTLDSDQLKNEKDYQIIKDRLLSIRGIGNWTADYIMLKCLDIDSAFPIADVGIHNALKAILHRDEKPLISEIEEKARAWQGHEAYMTFYLWRCLND